MNNQHADINVGNQTLTNFQPMPKRFMVWSISHKKWLKDRSGTFIMDLVDISKELRNNPHLPENCILVQSTNLFDKDGKEIFEGSIIKIPDDWDKYGMAAGEKYEVYFNAGGFRLKPPASYAVERGDRGYWLDDTTDFEMLGHILSNPELLECE